jgi:hypothetical protein
MLGCAVAAASVTFAVADATLWRNLPYRQPDQLMLLVTTHTGGETRVSVPDFLAARERLKTTPIAAAGTFTPEFALTGFGEPRQLRGRVVSADYFRTLGVPLSERRARRRYVVTASAVLSLALPVRAPDRLVRLSTGAREGEDQYSLATYDQIRRHAEAFDGALAFS